MAQQYSLFIQGRLKRESIRLGYLATYSPDPLPLQGKGGVGERGAKPLSKISFPLSFYSEVVGKESQREAKPLLRKDYPPLLSSRKGEFKRDEVPL